MRRRDLLPLIALGLALGTTVPPTEAWAWPAEKEKKKKSGGEGYLPIEGLTGTTMKSGGRRGVLSVDCGLQIDDPKLRDYAEKSLPRLRAAFVQVVQIYAGGLPSGAEPDTEFLVRSLQRQTDLILRRPGARLLIGAVVAN